MKKFLYLIGSMTCMCLMATSCSNQDEYEEGKYDWDMNAMTMASILPRGHYQGYWTIWDEKADSCEMAFDSESLGFSQMPIGLLLDLIDHHDRSGGFVGATSTYPPYEGSYAAIRYPFQLGDVLIQVKAPPFVLNPVLTGYSEKTVYFKNNIDKDYMAAQQSKFLTNIGEAHLNPYMGYVFSVKVDDKEWNYLLLFDQENYGVINIQQSSRVIKLYLKEVYIQTPAGKIDHMTFEWMVELAFISNDL